MEKVAVVGLGYVGLPVALGFARKVDTIGFDIDAEKVAELGRGHDRNREVPEEVLKTTKLRFTSKADDMKSATFFVVAVPTPVDHHNVPDLTPLERASETVGRVLKKGDVVAVKLLAIDEKGRLRLSRKAALAEMAAD